MNKKYLTSLALAATFVASPVLQNVEAAEMKHTVRSGDTLWKISQAHNVSVGNIKDWNSLSSDMISVGQTLIVSPETTSTYTVKSGDSLYAIAQKHHMTITELKSLNGLTSDSIQIGQVLEVSGESNSMNNTGTYKIVSGDSLSLIAKKHNTTVSKLKSLNGLSSDLIIVGQTLKVPNGSATHGVEKNATTYTVKAGDSLSKIAKNYGLTVSQLKSFNGLKGDMIYVGQVLKLTSNGSVLTPDKTNTFNVDALIVEGKKYMGVPYVWGGTSPSGFDCSGFLHYVYNKVGVSIPRTVATIWDATTPVSSPQKGDLVFFETYKAGPSHAGIYLGDGTFLHAGTSTGVTITSMNNPYWNARYLGAKSVK